jgi:hypothetical protein
VIIFIVKISVSFRLTNRGYFFGKNYDIIRKYIIFLTIQMEMQYHISSLKADTITIILVHNE